MEARQSVARSLVAGGRLDGGQEFQGFDQLRFGLHVYFCAFQCYKTSMCLCIMRIL